jgi:hypothetical protein
VSNEATSWAVRQDPGGSGPKLLLMILANHAGKDGVTYVGRELLAEECCSKRLATVTENFARLEARGFLTRLERRRDNGSRTSDWTILGPNAVDRGEMIDAGAERPESIVAIARRGTQAVPEGGTDSAPEAGGVRSAFPQPQVRISSTSGTDSVETRAVSEPSGEGGGTACSDEQAVASSENRPTVSLGSRDDLIELSNRLAEGVRGNDPKAKVKPATQAWLDPLRLLVDRDGRTVEEVQAVIDWCVADSFERKVVLSPAKLRARFSELAMKAGVAQPDEGDADNAINFGFRRRGGNRASVPAPQAPDAWLAAHPVTPELDAEWAPIEAELRNAVDESVFKLWLAGLHLHESGDRLMIGCPAHAKRWVVDRFGRLVAGAVDGRPYELVACGCDRKAAAA